MAFELLGIDNENEFYPAAFLTDALEDELKGALTRWREAASGAAETPDARLSSIRPGYLGALDQVRTASSAAEALGIWRGAASDLIAALGYVVNRDAAPAHDGSLVPVNGLHSSEFSPWFGDQLHAGNSLIGARRATYDARLLKPQAAANLWLKQIPTEIGWRGKRDANHVWQFLLPAADMAKFDTDRSITEFAGDAQDAIKVWRRNGFFAPFQEHELKLLVSLSEAVDQLFDAVADDLRAARSAANDQITIWPDRTMPGVSNVDFHAKLARLRVLQGDEHVSNSLPYQRLKTVMDAWCALWLWPLAKADLLPTRQEYLLGLQAILKGGATQSEAHELAEAEFAPSQSDLVERLERADSLARDLPSRSKQSALFQQTNIDALISASPWLKVAREVAARERFAHFDLIFADILRDREGFDLIVGNPPWSKPSWNEGDVIGDIDPAFVVRKLTAIQAREARAAALSMERDRAQFLAAYSSAKGGMNATGSAALNPFVGGGQNNLYRCFIDLAFRLTAPEGYAALIHQDGHLGDPKSGAFRRHWYARVAKHFHFRNEIKSKNFAEVHNEVSFSLNVYRGVAAQVSFEQFTQAFAASQVEDSYAHDGVGSIPAIKGEDGAWSIRGHHQRVMHIDKSALAVIHSLSEEAEAPAEEARFIQPYSASMLAIFKTMASFPKLESAMSGRDGGGAGVPNWQMSAVWHETNAQRDGTIERKTAFRSEDELVLQGPLFHVGNPLYKTPRAVCNSNKAYDVVDLTLVPDDYLPRTNYGPAIEPNAYRQRLPKCSWDATRTHLDFNRAAFRKMIALNGERSFIGTVFPRGVAHVDSVQSVAFANETDLLSASVAWSSVVIDFLVKAIGLQNLHDRQIASLPWVEMSTTAKHRILRLVCVTSAYADLWNRHAPNLRCEAWSSSDERLSLEGGIEGPIVWDRSAALRTEFARRLALLEIDVLVAQAFGVTLDQLLEIYRIYFPVLQENEGGTWFDQRGRIVWTCSMGLPGVGYLVDGKSPGRKAWEKIVSEAPVELACEAIDDTQPGGRRKITRRFIGPFTQHDRVEDYRRAWAHFERLQAAGAAA